MKFNNLINQKRPINVAVALYLVWVLIHLTLLTASKPSRYNRYRVFPFSSEGQQYTPTKSWQIDYVYDITEFAFYCAVPILIFYILRLLIAKNQTEQ